MNATFADFEDRLLPSLPGATRPAAMQAFYDSARTFFRRTRVWRTTLGAFTVREGEDTIPLNPVDQNTSVCFVEAYQAANSAGVTVFNAGVNGLANVSIFGQSHTLGLEDPHTVSIYPTPTQTFERALWIEVSVQPAPGVDFLPPEALTHFADALEAGCLSRMFKQPAKPYSNPAQAIFEARRFEAEMSRAVGNRLTNYGQRATPWRFNTVSQR